jgi:hypothetical protein
MAVASSVCLMHSQLRRGQSREALANVGQIAGLAGLARDQDDQSS